MNDNNTSPLSNSELLKKNKAYLQEIRGEVVLRIALLKKSEGQYDQVVPLCDSILVSHIIRINSMIYIMT